MLPAYDAGLQVRAPGAFMCGLHEAKTPALRRTVAVYLNKVVVTLVDRCNPVQKEKEI